MTTNGNKFGRRDFLKTVTAAGLGSALGSSRAMGDANDIAGASEVKFPQVPRRKLGKTGVEVPSLSLGCGGNLLEKQVLLRSAHKWGVTYWDTANRYAGGNSELGIGKFLKSSPELRKDLFIISKASRAESIDDVEAKLQLSLKRMNTSYIDLYYGVHALSEPSQLTDDLRKWADGAKNRGLIRHFGFSTHKNMVENLAAAAKLDWIDAIMFTYNFRLMSDVKLNAAIDACHKSGIGLIAMKTQAKRQEEEGKEDEKFIEHFLK